MPQHFKDYIESSSLPPSIKEVYRIDQFLKEKHKFYLNLITFLFPLFPNVNPVDLDKVASGAYLYFRFLLDLDSLLDNKKEMSEHQIFQRTSMAFEIYEESIKILSTIFEVDSPFWGKFRHYKSEYAKAIFTEKQFSKSRQPFSEESFEKLAAGKSAICYASISALSTLNGANQHEIKLEECLRHIHIALQYLDDIDDFKKDIIENQWSYPQYLVKEYLDNNYKIDVDIHLAHKYLFVSGIANSLLDKALYHYQIAINHSYELSLTDLNAFLLKQQSLVTFFKKEVKLLIEKTTSIAKKSHKLHPSAQISEAISAGQIFLTNNIQNNLWSDFMTSAGEGGHWISGFVGMFFAETNYSQEILREILISITKKNAFNDFMTPDADSTNFMVGFHWRMNQVIPKELIKNWLSFMNIDGSWSTYRNEKELRGVLELSEDVDVTAWLSSHTCVTAVATYVLSAIPALKNEYILSSDYLSNLLYSKGGLKAYWWTNDLYSASFALLALSTDPIRIKECNMLIKIILQEQNENGNWHNPTDKKPNAFYTALAVKALITFKPEFHRFEIQRGINWLMNNQTSDGSWLTGRILRIPATDVLDPEAVCKWRNSSFGVNTLVDDHNRIFTTSMVVNALYEYSIM